MGHRHSGCVPWRLVSGRPFRALGFKPKTQGKPGVTLAKFFSPFGPWNSNRPYNSLEQSLSFPQFVADYLLCVALRASWIWPEIDP
jgi:hypothetical protein